MNREIYSNPLAERYSSKEMLEILSPKFKFSTWRKLWYAFAFLCVCKSWSFDFYSERFHCASLKRPEIHSLF